MNDDDIVKIFQLVTLCPTLQLLAVTCTPKLFDLASLRLQPMISKHRCKQMNWRNLSGRNPPNMKANTKHPSTILATYMHSHEDLNLDIQEPLHHLRNPFHHQGFLVMTRQQQVLNVGAVSVYCYSCYMVLPRIIFLFSCSRIQL